MRLLAARHFWKDKKIATWEKHTNFSQKAMNWLETNYSMLVSDTRKCFYQDNWGTVFLFYNDEKDIYGRSATQLIAFWVKKKIKDPTLVYEQIQHLFNVEQFPNAMEINLPKKEKETTSIYDFFSNDFMKKFKK